MKALKVTGKILAGLSIVIGAVLLYIRLVLPDTGPPPEIRIERTLDRIERGKYLANHVMVCMDCHSTRDWSRYAGPMLPGGYGGGGEAFTPEMGFPGRFFSPNITPYALQDWTDGEILRAVTGGVNKEGKALFPVMAYHRFGQLDREDIYSIIAYIRELPAVEHDVPASEPDFPVSFLINTMPKRATFTKRPAPDNLVAYGKYLVNAAGCVDCHSQTSKGEVIPGTEFGGGTEFRSAGGTMRSPNITMHRETGIGNWTKADFVKRFKAYADSTYQAPRLGSGDVNTPMPWSMYAGMKEQDLEAIYAYLCSIRPSNHQVARVRKSTLR
ncbi:c-type cytochrome [Dyadobacter sandarakinus]|uniref:C-type cytochrome n=1 Tax=Dyadobacter sandarakinus TaxID=2747268 RepID=A0ABX7I4D8_9BACT|nr:c-type cytochrome [Dyadobacter sandarakinus]QRR00640.1 c-type cytochrome [Dyadobacter sandarakinus]